jgi:hypothetical protein
MAVPVSAWHCCLVKPSRTAFVRVPVTLVALCSLMISAQASAAAQTAGAACSKVGAKSVDGAMQCKKVRVNGKTVQRWTAFAAARSPQPPKGPSKKECLVGQWAETPASMQLFLRQYAPSVPTQVSGQLLYSFDGANLTASGEMTVSSADPAASISGTVKGVGKPFPSTYDGIALSMRLTADSDYPRFFDVSLSVNGTPIAIPTGSPGGPAFFPVSCSGNNAWITVQTPRGVVVRVLDRRTA